MNLLHRSPAEAATNLDALVGQPADVALTAMHYLAGRPVGANPPETQWVTNGREGVLCGVLWEESRIVSRVELAWVAGAAPIPMADDIIVEVWMPRQVSQGWEANNDWFNGQWEVVRGERGAKIDGGVWGLTFNRPYFTTKLRARLRSALDAGRFAVPELRAYRSRSWQWRKMTVELENDFQGDTKKSTRPPVVDVYNGLVGAVRPLADPGRHGVAVDVLYGAQNPEPFAPDFAAGPVLEMIRQDHGELQANQSVVLTPLAIGTKAFNYGLGTHAVSHLRVRAQSFITCYKAWAGVDCNDQTRGGNGSVVFAVEAGGKKLYESPVKRGGQEGERVELTLDHTNSLDLHVGDAGDGQSFDQADWAEAEITTADGKTWRLDQMKFIPPGWLNYEDAGNARANRTAVTVRGADGRAFSFAPEDLAGGEPMLVPDNGYFVAVAGGGQSAKAYQKALKARGLATVRERVRALPEQSWEHVMKAVHPTTYTQPYPVPPYETVVKIDVPDPALNDAWRIGAWHLKRHLAQQPGGVWAMLDYPYPVLGQESYLIVRTLDEIGEHEVARGGLQWWLNQQGEGKSMGLTVDSVGCLAASEMMDQYHGLGTAMVLGNIADHYALTGERAWLERVAPNIEQACDWVLRQRAAWDRQVAGKKKNATWMAGFMPPFYIGDIKDWRPWYMINAYYSQGLQRGGEALAVVNPAAGRRILKEAEAYRKQVVVALERSRELSPVIRVGDGTWRSPLPPAPYMRGLASQVMDPAGGGHGGQLWTDVEFGGLVFPQAGVLAPEDPRVDAALDIIEDNGLTENKPLHRRKADYDASRDWFDHAGYHYQAGYMLNSLIYLRRDDVPNFLRSFYNQYASQIIPGDWTFREHSPEHPVHDKIFEEAAFLERLRCMLVMEDRHGATDVLWLAKGMPRAWLAQGQKIAVRGMPTFFGEVSYVITSDVARGRITAEVELPSRLAPAGQAPGAILLRLRHPEAKAIKTVTVNGKAWEKFDPQQETIDLAGLSGRVRVEAGY